ncbi:hypothetical protein B0T10DRAFT_466109 [Thelonectria olida]|uniref:Uncharacterized protein n=1 Tax=Thelonectria olida TaxID=1576542 RepID=A0A9P9AI67_9HYPO|nr:hypothetical protein B0T10DRAFT_466109 [Thelonectria olida]
MQSITYQDSGEDPSPHPNVVRNTQEDGFIEGELDIRRGKLFIDDLVIRCVYDAKGVPKSVAEDAKEACEEATEVALIMSEDIPEWVVEDVSVRPSQPVTLVTQFPYLEAYSALLCLDCGSCLPPSRRDQERHLRGPSHRLRAPQLAALLNLFAGYRLRVPAEVVPLRCHSLRPARQVEGPAWRTWVLRTFFTETRHCRYFLVAIATAPSEAMAPEMLAAISLPKAAEEEPELFAMLEALGEPLTLIRAPILLPSPPPPLSLEQQL